MEAIYLQKLKEEIKQKIIEVGKLKFKKEGYENTSMKDIASDVGISTGNIYRYFLTKKHLLAEILKEIENEIEEFFEKIPSDYDDSSSYQLFDSLIEFTLRLAEDKGDTLKVMFNSEKESQFIEFREKQGSGGKLFGSVTEKEISEKLKEKINIEVSKKKRSLKVPIKNVGNYVADIKLYEGVNAKLKIVVIGM